jgi:hypothetical protein
MRTIVASIAVLLFPVIAAAELIVVDDARFVEFAFGGHVTRSSSPASEMSGARSLPVLIVAAWLRRRTRITHLQGSAA